MDKLYITYISICITCLRPCIQSLVYKIKTINIVFNEFCNEKMNIILNFYTFFRSRIFYMLLYNLSKLKS